MARQAMGRPQIHILLPRKILGLEAIILYKTADS